MVRIKKLKKLTPTREQKIAIEHAMKLFRPVARDDFGVETNLNLVVMRNCAKINAVSVEAKLQEETLERLPANGRLSVVDDDEEKTFNPVVYNELDRFDDSPHLATLRVTKRDNDCATLFDDAGYVEGTLLMRALLKMHVKTHFKTRKRRR